MYLIRLDNKIHTHGYPSKLNLIWRVFSVLTEFEFSPISKHGYGMSNEYIGTYPELIPKPVPNVEKLFYVDKPCYFVW